MKYVILLFLLFTLPLTYHSSAENQAEPSTDSIQESNTETDTKSRTEHGKEPPDKTVQETKPEAKAGSEVAPAQESNTDPNIKSRTEPVAVPKTETIQDTDTGPENGTEAEPVQAPATEPKIKSRTESKIESNTKAIPESKGESIKEIKAEPPIDTKTVANYDIRNSIVKIYTQTVSPYYSDPWTMDSAKFHTGSGCIISGNRILTNAHVIANHTLVQVRRYGEARRYTARVLHVSHETDLAVLTVENPGFFEDTEPLKIGMLPKTQEEVLVYGFPKGGDTLSITKGVISRIEHEVYAQSNLPFLAAQIDAPINPGNSGGPAINNGKVVGIIMQTLIKSENIGYMVPPPVIKHFLTDIRDSEYKGYPSLGIRTQNIENEGLKKKYGLKDKYPGVLVTKVIPGSPADGTIMVKDVLLSIEGKPISGNGTVEFRPKERTHYSYYIQNKQVNDTLDLEVLRNGEKVKINVLLDTPIQDIQLVKIQNDVLPSYFIYGGLVFSTLTINYLQEWGNQWYRKAPSDLVTVARNNSKTAKDEEVVLLIRVLASEVNLGYHENENLIIKKVNGNRINNMQELVDIVQTSEGDFISFEDADGNEIVIDKNKADKTNQRILKIYRIRADMSDDLKKPEELTQTKDGNN
ncbi:MAG: S1C family serine protease [Thermodesulfobacteriota bacterium]